MYGLQLMFKNKFFQKVYFLIAPCRFTEKTISSIEKKYKRRLSTIKDRNEQINIITERNFELQIAEDDLGIFLSNKLITIAKKYYLPLNSHFPEPETREEVSEEWNLSIYHFYYLNDKGRYNLRKKIEEERKTRRDRNSHVLFLISGIIGISTGFLSILKDFVL